MAEIFFMIVLCGFLRAVLEQQFQDSLVWRNESAGANLKWDRITFTFALVISGMR